MKKSKEEIMNALNKATNKSFLKILSITMIVLICFPVKSTFAQTSTGMQITGQDKLEISEDQINPGWHFDSFFLGVELINNMASLHISNVQESPLNGDIFAIGAGETTTGNYKGLLMRYRNGEWTINDEFEIPNNDNNQILSIPMHVHTNGDVYYSDGYNLIINRFNSSTNIIRNPDNSDLPEPGYEGDRMVDVTQDDNGKMWLLYSYPRLVGFTSYNQPEFDIYDHTNSPLPDPAETSHITEEHPMRYLASTGDDLWITTYHEDGGLFRKTEDDWDHFTTENSDLPSNWVSAVVAQSGSQLLVSTFPTEFEPSNGGLMRFEDDEWAYIEGTSNNFVRVHAVEEDTYIWASIGNFGDTEDNTRSGRLVEYDGTSWSLIADEGEFYNQLNWLTVDSNNNKWLGGDFLVINAGVASLNQNFVSFNNVPQAGNYYIAGNTFFVSWNVGSRIESVDLYRSDENSDWIPVVENIPVETLNHQITFPDEHEFEMQLLVTKSGTFSIQDISDSFFVFNPDEYKYHLRRQLSNGGFELFDPQTHGWSMRNREEVMWPEEDWEDIEYSTLFTLPPISAKPEDFPSWDLMRQAFGDDEVTIGNTNIADSGAIIAWRILKHNGFQGVCHGFAVTSLLAFNDGIESLSTEAIGINLDVEQLYDAEAVSDVRNGINTVWTRQFGIDHLMSFMLSASGTGSFLKGPNETLEEVKEMLERTSTSSYHNAITLMPPDNLSAAHSILPFKAEENPDAPHIWDIYVHDSNFPWIDSLKVQINTDNDYWWYSTPALDEDENLIVVTNYEGYAGLFLSDRVDAYLTTSRLPKSQSDHQNNLYSKLDELNEMGYTYSLFSAGTELTIRDELENEISYADSLLSSGVPGSLPIIPTVGGIHPPIGYFLPIDQYDIEVNFENGGDIFSIQSDKTLYVYSTTELPESGVDLLRIGNSMSVLGNSDGHERTVNMTVIEAGESKNKMFSILGAVIANTDSLKFEISEGNNLIVNNYGASSSVTLELRDAIGDDVDYFLYENFDLLESSGFKFIPDWDDVSNNEVTVQIDTNLDGEYDESITLESMPTSIDEEDMGHHVIPDGYKLYQNYPNPFNPATTIQFAIPQSGNVELVVYDMLGREIATLINEHKDTGYHEVVFDAGNLSSGVYLYRISTGSFVETRRLTLIK